MTATNSESDRHDNLVAIVAAHTGRDRDDLDLDARVADIGLDSITSAEILAEAEEKTGATLHMRDVPDDWSHLTVGELVAVLAAALRDGSGR